MKLSRLAPAFALCVAVFVASLGACGNGDVACGPDGTKPGVCQAGPTCGAGTVELGITNPFDMCSQNGLSGPQSVCCIEAPDGALGSTIDGGRVTAIPDATSTVDAKKGGGKDGSTSHPTDSGHDVVVTPPVDGGADTNEPHEAGSDVVTVGETGTDAPLPHDGEADGPAKETGAGDGGHDAVTTSESGVDGGTDGATEAATDGGVDANLCGAKTSCTLPTDCPTPDTACVVAECNLGCCATTNALTGTACTDNGGTSCNGQGLCVVASCTDGIQDGTETDIDCGGSCGATCRDTPVQQKCDTGGDCINGVCSGTPKVCQVPTCTDTVRNGDETGTDCGGATCDALGDTCADGTACNLGADCKSGNCSGGVCAGVPNGGACTGTTDCASGFCANGVCCNSACDGTCQACTALAKGSGSDGTCGSIAAGTTAPAGQCTASVCGNTGFCGAGGACAQVSAGTQCGDSASCTNGVLTPASTCGGGTCNAGTAATCAGGFVCADPTSCETTCSTAADCETSGYACVGGTCALPTCTDGVQDGNETSIDCGGTCGTCTVLVLGAGSTSTFGGEFHPESTAWTTTSLGGESVDGLAITMTNAGANAIGVMRFTQFNNAADQQVQSTSWATATGFTSFVSVGNGITTAAAPTVGLNGAIVLSTFRGTDDNYYFLTHGALGWSGASPIEPLGGGQSSGPEAPAYDPGLGTFAFGGDNSQVYAQTSSAPGIWNAAVNVDSTNLTQLPPAIVDVGGNDLLVYVRSSDGQVFYATSTAGAWSAPAAITSAFTGDVVALAAAGSTAYLALRGQDTNLYYAVYSAGAWSAVTAFATPNVSIASAPAITHGVGAASAEIAYVQTSDQVAYHARLIGQTWTTPVAIGGSGLSRVAITSAP